MKTSEAASLVFQWIFVLNSVKHKFFPVSIVKTKIMAHDPVVTGISNYEVIYKIT